MGNRALRKKLAEVLGSRTIYTGHKLAAFKVLSASRLRRLIADLSVKEGDVIHDCTGFNHRITEMKPEWGFVSDYLPRWREGRYVDGEFLREVDILFEGGKTRCSCSAASSAKSVSDIEEWWLSWIEAQWKSEHNWANSDYCRELHRRIKAGEKICDEHGILLPDLEKLGRDINT